MNLVQKIFKKHSASSTALFGIAALLTLIKLWLTSGQMLVAVSCAYIDDELFIHNANEILLGHWLGSYSFVAMSKGIFYPLYIAAMYAFHIPLLFSQQVLYTVACIIFLFAVAPLFKKLPKIKPFGLFIIYIALLFIPYTYNDNVSDEVLRDYVFAALTLINVACIFAIWLRYNDDNAKILRWSILFGFSLSAAFLTREDAAWIWPLIIVLFLIIAISLIVCRKKIRNFAKRGAILLIPFFLLVLSNVAVATANKINYGIFETTDTSSSAYLNAYNALCRVTPEHWEPDVPVSTDAIEKIYKVSPSFLKLKPYINGTYANWKRTSDSQFDGAHFMWVLRMAVDAAGYYKSGMSATNFYNQLASEVNSACDSGKLKSHPKSLSFAQCPPWDSRYLTPTISTFKDSIFYTVNFKEFSPYPIYSIGDPSGITYFENMTNTLAFIDPGQLPKFNLSISAYEFNYQYNHKLLTALKIVGNIYQKVFAVLAYASFPLYLIITIMLIYKLIRRHPLKCFKEWLFTTGCLLTYLLRLLMLSFVQVSSFPTIRPQYLSSVVSIMLIFVLMTFFISTKIGIQLFSKSNS